MAPIFVPEDIEALVRHFPPLSLLPGDGKPTLVNSHSSDGLVDFTHALSRFEHILEHNDSRIEISSICSILGIEENAERHILNCCTLQLYFSKDGKTLIPVSAADAIHQDLNDLTRISFVDIGAFAAKRDVAVSCIEQWIRSDGGLNWQLFEIEDRRFLCDQSLRAELESRIRNAINASGSDVCNVSSAFDGEVQTPILKELAKHVTEGQGGDVIVDGAHVLYVPSEYSAAAEERYRQSQLDQVHVMATELEDNRFSVLRVPANNKKAPVNSVTYDVDGLEEAVRTQFMQWHPEGTQLRTLVSSHDAGDKGTALDQKSRTLVDAGVLQHELSRLKAAAIALVEEAWTKDGTYPDASAAVQSLRVATVSPRPGLAQLVLHSECIAELEQAARERIEDLQQSDHSKLLQLLDDRLLVPFQLYAAGINHIADDTLKQHLEDFVYDNFRREVIPQTVKSAQEQKLLREKSTHREVEKLRQAIVDAKTFSALQTSITKFTKKLKISAPSKEVVEAVRVRTIKQNVKAMKQMARGSDVLQNLIWVLLAQRNGGLYMSSGKDTTRMIKQYEAVGDAEMSTRLLKWRDLLKAGEDGKEELQMMRAVAKSVAEEIAAAAE